MLNSLKIYSRKLKLILGLWCSILVAMLSFLALSSFFDFDLLALWVSCGIAFFLAYIIHTKITHPDQARLVALKNGLSNLLDNDFSVSLSQNGSDDIDELLRLYNAVSEKLRKERQYIYQRELLLDTVIQSSSLALLLMDQHSRIVYSNANAKHLMNMGKPLNGLRLSEVLKNVPKTLSALIKNSEDGLFTVDQESHTEAETFHLSNGRFVLNALEHRLILIKKLTRELQRQEIATWKKVIRVISHELNNSLAPISSMAHSGKLALSMGKQEHLVQVLDTISERSLHLTNFVGNYAKVAKLPEPIKALVAWDNFITHLKTLSLFALDSDLPKSDAYFDQAQIEQVMVNLLKNAHESGSHEKNITLCVDESLSSFRIEIKDRGCGMTPEILSQALLPFYTTKKQGSGIGLPLCREIIELHGGTMALENRKAGGLKVSIDLPKAEYFNYEPRDKS